MHQTQLDFPAFPLSLLDDCDLGTQKCYVPKEEDIPSTGWCRCVLSDGSFAVCWATTRAGSETCCFLDGMVTSTSKFSPSNQQLVLLEPLEMVSCPERISCVVTITQELLQRPQVSMEDLKDDVSVFLRHLKLTKGCCVQHKRLTQLGIACVEILDVPGVAVNECFEIDRDTELLLKDTRLALPYSLVSTSTYLPHSFEQSIADLEHLLVTSESSFSHRFPTTALVVGPVGSGKSHLLGEFLRRHTCNCFYITASQVLRSYPGETEEELRRIFQAAEIFKEQLRPLLPIVILIEDLELLCPSSSSADPKNSSNSLRISAQLYKLIDALPQGIICVATSGSPDSLHEHARRRFVREVSIEMPSEEQRRQLVKELCQAHELDVSDTLLDHIARNTQGYVMADLNLLLRRVQQELLTKETSSVEQVFRQSLLQTQPSASRGTDVRVSKMTAGFEVIGGMESLKRTLQVSVLAGLRQSAAFARFGLTLPKGVLLYGPPGCAKTTIAKCLAKEANMTFIATSAAEVYSPYVGCAERFISRIFDTARKNAPCLIFLDEIDSLVGRRTVSSGGGGGQVQLRILSTLLTEMDGIVGGGTQQHILVVAATNRPDMIDDALIRPGRFDKLIHVPAPDEESRLALLKLHAKRMPFHRNVVLDEIATRTDRCSGADLCNLCNEAAIEAFQRDFEATEIELQDFEKVLAKQKSSLTQNQIDAYYKFASRFS
ncbi:transitional endoplasmic reticulum ATPase isoform X2 [Drosophila ficusphila]|uniref:transitional endoplasmic reticulum ATPase isoform X2 n=1 Tax=Drosophila ficusphila TaxID=30025 RepID=UPI0007E66739|nr:transitional endoplasmic reticulum ATPase isoform X2 [Drosophila ficusphila]